MTNSIAGYSRTLYQITPGLDAVDISAESSGVLFARGARLGRCAASRGSALF